MQPWDGFLPPLRPSVYRGWNKEAGTFKDRHYALVLEVLWLGACGITTKFDQPKNASALDVKERLKDGLKRGALSSSTPDSNTELHGIIEDCLLSGDELRQFLLIYESNEETKQERQKKLDALQKGEEHAELKRCVAFLKNGDVTIPNLKAVIGSTNTALPLLKGKLDLLQTALGVLPAIQKLVRERQA